jgi:hypothetical protein
MNLKNRLFIGFMLVIVIASIYAFYTHQPIEKKELISLRGRLMDSPKLIEHGEGMQYYSIKIQLIGNNKQFYIRDCAFEVVDVDSVLALNAGTTVEFLVKETDYENEDKINIYAFTVNEKYDYLNLDKFNHCHENYWKRLIPFLVLIIGLVIYRVFFFPKNKNKPTDGGDLM